MKIYIMTRFSVYDYKFKGFSDKDLYEIENELFDKKQREQAYKESTA